jgi:hypothetical protein
MKDLKRCNVDGCENAAMWRHEEPSQANGKVLLCVAHWNVLRLTHPERVPRYLPLHLYESLRMGKSEG